MNGLDAALTTSTINYFPAGSKYLILLLLISPVYLNLCVIISIFSTVTVNNGENSVKESSIWQIAEVILFDFVLPKEQIQLVEEYLGKSVIID